MIQFLLIDTGVCWCLLRALTFNLFFQSFWVSYFCINTCGFWLCLGVWGDVCWFALNLYAVSFDSFSKLPLKVNALFSVIKKGNHLLYLRIFFNQVMIVKFNEFLSCKSLPTEHITFLVLINPLPARGTLCSSQTQHLSLTHRVQRLAGSCGHVRNDMWFCRHLHSVPALVKQSGGGEFNKWIWCHTLSCSDQLLWEEQAQPCGLCTVLRVGCI